MWNWRSNNLRRRKVTSAPAESRVEPLETRALLAGNVVASLNGSHLTVTGDDADNSVELTLINNNVQIRGLNNTTVNGGTDVFVVAANTDTVTGKVLIKMGAGNDTVAFNRSVKLAGAVTVDGQAGNDTIVSTGATFQSPVTLYGKAGDDTFSLQDSTASDRLTIYGQKGDDLISLKNMTLNGNVRIKTHGGADGVSFDNVTSTAKVLIHTGMDDDDVIVQNSNASGSVLIKTKQNSDAVFIEDNTFNGRVHVNLGRDNDGINLRNTNTFNRKFSVQGGDSRQNDLADFRIGDAASISNTNVFNAGQRVRWTEETTFSTAANDRVDAPTTGLIARAAAADAAAKTLSTPTLTAAATAAAASSLTSAGVLITKDPNVTISGVTVPGAVVAWDADDDGQFDDGTVTADSSGDYSISLVLTRQDLYTADSTANDQLTGLQTIKLRSTVSPTEKSDASVTVDLIKATNSLVRFTSITDTGATQEYFMELFNDEAPIAVGNFLDYSTSGRYTNTIIHRAPSDFVLQGGGFTVNNGVVKPVNTDAAIMDEFNAARGNIAGTLSMAKTSLPNSGTSGWFVNLTDANAASLDPAQHTVFGRIVGNGITVVNAIADLTVSNINDALGFSSTDISFRDTPLRTPFVALNRTLTGTVSTTASSTQIVGTGTKFTTELGGSLSSSQPRSRIQINGQSFYVASIVDDTHLTLATAPTTTASNLSARSDFASDNQFVRFSSVTEVLPST